MQNAAASSNVLLAACASLNKAELAAKTFKLAASTEFPASFCHIIKDICVESLK
jgi:hypothetical protein